MRELVKKTARFFCGLLAWPMLLRYALWRVFLGPERAFQQAAQTASRWPGLGGQYLRAALLGWLIRRMGRDVVIAFGSVLTKRDVELDDGVYIGSYCLLGQVRVGADTLIADHVCIPSGSQQHGTDRLDVPVRQQEGQFKTISIGRDCWIGSGSVVLADVGDHCVVAAGSVVVQPVQEYQIVGGNPARVIGDRRKKAPASGGSTPALPVREIGEA